MERRRFRRLNLNGFPSPHNARRASGIAVHQHAAIADPLLNPRAAILRHAFVNYLVQTFAGVLRLRPEAHPLNQASDPSLAGAAVSAPGSASDSRTDAASSAAT